MGFKRPFDGEEFQELPYKNSRQHDFRNKLTQFSEYGPCNVPEKPDISSEDGGAFRKYQLHQASENGSFVNELENSVDKGFETSASLSWVNSSFNEEAYASLSLDHFEFDFPRRTFVPFENSYSTLGDRSPRKQVPIGPDHQASLPSWSGRVNKNMLDSKGTLNADNSSNYLGSNNVLDNEYEEKLMGTCVIPMPDSNMFVHNSNKAGECIRDCDCLDEGSIRCVRQHVMEARERLLKSLGHENFVKLGFYDMGEEVSCKWSEEEEQVFHEVVYTNPISSGRDFWKHLSAAFLSRTKKEIVSYYFNVFMLQRRAAQNRSHLLDNDSDDDEWHRGYGGSDEVLVTHGDDDSVVESPIDQENQADCEDDSSDEDDDGDGGDVGDDGGHATGDYSGTDHISEACISKSFEEGGFISVDPDMNKTPGRAEDSFNVQDDSCTSFEFQPDMVDSCGPVDAEHALQVSGLKTDLSRGLRGFNDLVGHVYLMDSCDAKVWDARYTSPIKGVDLLPTCNIIEEIFGQGTWDTKTRND